MATTSAGNPYVESSDLVANYPATSLALANRLDKYAVNPFADAAARDAAIPTPVQGQLAQTLDDNKVWRYDGTAWAPFSGAVGAASFTNTPTGTFTDAGIDYSYITFTGTGNIEFDVAGFIDILLIGAGGGSGTITSGSPRETGGGGAGQLLEIFNAYVPLGTSAVVIGAGGTAHTVSTYGFGNPSYMLPYFSVGGGSGGTQNRQGGSGSSGGGGGDESNAAGGLAISVVTGFDGAQGGSSAGIGGGGGGAGSAASGRIGGVGAISSMNNVSTTYSTGGSSSDRANAAANTGNGASGSNATGFVGGSGIVIIRTVV